jgi:hypothetical protein
VPPNFLVGFQQFVEAYYGFSSPVEKLHASFQNMKLACTSRNWVDIIIFFEREDRAFDKFYELMDLFLEKQGTEAANYTRG